MQIVRFKKMNTLTRNHMPYLIFISAKTEKAFTKKITQLCAWIHQEGKEHAIGDVSFTLVAGRGHFSIRSAWIVTDMEELACKLDEVSKTGSTEGFIKNDLNEFNGYLTDEKIKMAEISLNKAKSRQSTGTGEYLILLEELKKAYINGFNGDWISLYENLDVNRISMPVYPFDGKSYWIPTVSPDVNSDLNDEDMIELFTKLQSGEIEIEDVQYLIGSVKQ